MGVLYSPLIAHLLYNSLTNLIIFGFCAVLSSCPFLHFAGEQPSLGTSVRFRQIVEPVAGKACHSLMLRKDSSFLGMIRSYWKVACYLTMRLMISNQ